MAPKKAISAEIQYAEKRANRTSKICMDITLVISMFFGLFLSLLSFLGLSLNNFFTLNIGVAFPNSNTFKVLCNTVFATSEKFQSYTYDFYKLDSTVDISKELVTGIIAVSLFLLILCTVLVRLKNKILTSVYALGLIGIAVYLGIFPGMLPCLLLVFSFSVLFLSKTYSKHDVVLLTAILALLIVIFFLAGRGYSSPSKTISNYSEIVRDKISMQFENPNSISLEAILKEIEENREYKKQFTNDSNDADKNSEDFKTNAVNSMTASTAGAKNENKDENKQRLILLCAVITVLVLWRVVRYVIVCIKKSKFNSKDKVVAANAMLSFLMSWYSACGLTKHNTSRFNYKSQVENIASSQSAEEYVKFIEMWEEARYSNHAFSDKMRTDMISLMDLCLKDLKKHTKIYKRIAIRLFMAV